jgi:outer membrane biogenesis lipoprotein LolB
MRAILVASVSLVLAACASQQPAPAEKSAAETPAPKPTAQCYSGDHSRFFAVGEKAEISGVAVTCKASADGKAGQWVGGK